MTTEHFEPMDIYSKDGTKVIYTGKNGYDHDKEFADKHLTIGETYTVDHTEVHGWYTDVYLKEVPNNPFNSVHFVTFPSENKELGEAERNAELMVQEIIAICCAHAEDGCFDREGAEANALKFVNMNYTITRNPHRQ